VGGADGAVEANGGRAVGAAVGAAELVGEGAGEGSDHSRPPVETLGWGMVERYGGEQKSSK
jgi:hypothetical protein